MSIKVAVVGNGYWGKNLVRNFLELGALRTICDYNPCVEASMREKYSQISICREYSDVLTDEGVDAIALATPAAIHYEMAKRALQAGKDVFATDTGIYYQALAAAQGDIARQLAGAD